MNTNSYFHPSLERVPQGRTRFRVPGLDPWLQLNRSETRIAVATPQIEDRLEISGTPDEVKVDRYGPHYDVTFKRDGDDIHVDRPGAADDMIVRKHEDQLLIDRPGLENDVTAKFSDKIIEVHHYASNSTYRLENYGEDVAVRTNGHLTEIFPASLMPGGAWPEGPSAAAVADFAGMGQQVARTLDDWSENGIQFDDLIRVTREGDVWTFDNEYR